MIKKGFGQSQSKSRLNFCFKVEENDPEFMPEITVTVGKTENVTRDEIDLQ